MLKLNIEQVIAAIATSKSIAETNEKVGYSRNSTAGYRRINNIIKEYKIDISHFTGQRWSKGTNVLTNDRLKSKYCIDEIFIENSKVSRSHAKTLILKNKLIPYICSECNLTEWRGRILSLDLEHKNGIRNDHRLENLTFLCPNCHSITDTYKGKNKKSKLPVPDSRILELFPECKSIRDILIKLDLAAEGGNYNRIKRILKENNLSFIKSKIISNTHKCEQDKFSIKREKKRLNTCLICQKPAINKYCSYACTHTASNRTQRPTRSDLMDLIFKMPVIKIAEQFGVTNNSVKKWCKIYEIDTPPVGYWTRRTMGYSHEESMLSQAKETKPQKKFTKEQFLEIVKLIKKDEISLREIGRRYNVSHATISDIKHGYTYKNYLTN